MLVIYKVNVPRRTVRVGEKQDTSWELTKKGCSVRGRFGLSLIPPGAMQCMLQLRACALAAVLGVCVGAWDSAGSSADAPSLLHSLLSACLSQGHKSERVPQACLSKRKCTKLIRDYVIPH